MGHPSSSAALNLFYDSCHKGAALAPANGFFPTMEAAGLFAARRDTEATVALEHAATCLDWEDYTTQATRGELRLVEATVGEVGETTKQYLCGNRTFAHYGFLMALARNAVLVASRREAGGDTEGGFRIRRALARIGARMRERSRFFVGSLRGCEIVRLAGDCPAGAPALAYREDGDNEDANDAGGSPLYRQKGEGRRAARAEARYIAYLYQIHHPEEAAWFVRESHIGQGVSALRPVFAEVWFEGLVPFSFWWSGGVLLLLNAFYLLLLGGIATLLSRARRVREGLPLARGVRTGFMLLLLSPFAALAASWLRDDGWLYLQALERGIVCGVASALLIPLILLGRGENGRGWGKSLCAAVATVTGSFLLLSLMLYSATGGESNLPILVLIPPCALDRLPGINTTSLVNGLLLGMGTLIFPFSAVLIFLLRPRFRRLPVSQRLLQGFRENALSGATALLCVYLLVIAGTMTQEAKRADELRKRLNHEGRYLAARAGRAWE